MLQQPVAAVVLSQGDRGPELAAAVDSVRRQELVDATVIIVWNGAAIPSTSPADVDIHCERNVGIPAGRNLGADRADAEFVLFLDDDASIIGTNVVHRAIELMRADDRLDVVGLHIVDADGRTSPRHVPRLGGRGADRSGLVAGFLGGACVVRRDRFVAVGGFAAEFDYAMEESDLMLALIDSGSAIWYAADLTVFHPRTEPSRHPGAAFRTARNRVWLAYRRLPALVGCVYVVDWLLISSVRQPRSIRAQLSGSLAGWRERTGPRRPISWRTVWKLSRLGRPPVV